MSWEQDEKMWGKIVVDQNDELDKSDWSANVQNFCDATCNGYD